MNEKRNSQPLAAGIVFALMFFCAVPAYGEAEGSAGAAQATVSRVEIRGAKGLKVDRLANAIGVTAGGEYSQQELVASCSRILRLYGDAGYPWADVQVFVRGDSAGASEILFSIEEGRRARVADVSYSGNALTKEAVLARQSGVREGEHFSLSGLEDARMRLATWDMYDEIGDIDVYEDAHPYRVSLLVPVVESKPHSLSGLLGFGPGKEGESRVWGNASFVMKNIMGTARRLEMNWSQSAPAEKSMHFSYLEPWLGGTPVSGEASFSQRVRESSFTQIELGAQASSVFSRVGRLGVGFAHELVYPQGESEEAVPRSTKESLTVSLSYRRPETRSFPSLRSLTVRTSFGFRKDPESSTKETVVDSGYESLVWRRGAVSARVLGGLRAAFASNDLSPSFLTIPFGGSSSVRGHRDGELYILRALWAQSELSFESWGAAELHVFFDQAFAAVPRSEESLATSYPSGYGAGVSALTGVGRIRVDLGLDPRRGFSRAMLHVGMQEEF
jgi:outer membrane protein assembly factor BamA